MPQKSVNANSQSPRDLNMSILCHNPWIKTCGSSVFQVIPFHSLKQKIRHRAHKRSPPNRITTTINEIPALKHIYLKFI